MEVKLTKSRKDDTRPQKRKPRNASKVESSEELQPLRRSLVATGRDQIQTYAVITSSRLLKPYARASMLPMVER
jgi:hypothetical protein